MEVISVLFFLFFFFLFLLFFFFFSSAYEHGQCCGSDEGRCGLQKVHHVAAQLFLRRCSTAPLLRSCFSEEGAEL